MKKRRKAKKEGREKRMAFFIRTSEVLLLASPHMQATCMYIIRPVVS